MLTTTPVLIALVVPHPGIATAFGTRPTRDPTAHLTEAPTGFALVDPARGHGPPELDGSAPVILAGHPTVTFRRLTARLLTAALTSLTTLSSAASALLTAFPLLTAFAVFAAFALFAAFPVLAAFALFAAFPV